MLILSNLIGWKKKFYTSVNSMSMNIGITFLPQTPDMYNYVNKKDFADKVGIIRNESLFLWIVWLCKLLQ